MKFREGSSYVGSCLLTGDVEGAHRRVLPAAVRRAPAPAPAAAQTLLSETLPQPREAAGHPPGAALAVPGPRKQSFYELL